LEVGGRTMAVFRSMPKGFDPLVRLWVLRLLVGMDAYRFMWDDMRITEPGVLRAAGIPVPEVTLDFEPRALLVCLRTQLAITEKVAPKAPRTATLTKNVAWLAKTLGLDPVETDIVLFLALAHHATALGKAVEKFGQLKTHEVHALIATATGHPFDKVSQAMRHTGKLIRSSLITLDLASKWNFDAKVSLLNGIADQLALEHLDQSEMFLSNFRRTGAPALGLDDYPHLAADLQVMAVYLRRALDTGQQGVNVLLWGPPGTGKTELAKAMAEHLGAPLYEIAVEDRNGNIHKGEARLGAYALAQGVLGGGTRSLVLFDEIEDVFRASEDREGPGGLSNQSGRKGWVNRTLQENPVPAFWVTNSRWALDPAYRRRFDLVVEVGVPPRSVRAKILDLHLADLPVTASWKAMAAEHEGLSPAAVERAAKVVRVVLEARSELVADDVVGRVVENALVAQGAPRRPRMALMSPTTYRLDILNADRDLEAICSGLKRTGSGRLCLYGPPGTGKTAFGHHLAEVLDRPLLMKRGSDLQSKWLGETEQNMARMFEEASADNAVLLLDEADSFLQDRRGAERSWEVSQVNEILTQLESFSGIFIASTNLMDRLDQASLRRFDAKVKFGYLGRVQITSMFMDSLGLLGLLSNPAAERQVASLTNLTPGDFAAALRQARLAGATTAEEFAGMLVAECAIKGGGPRRPIGFGGRSGC